MQRVYTSSCRLWFQNLCYNYTKNNYWTSVQVHSIKCFAMYGIEIQIPSTMSSKKTSWVVICWGQNRYVEELLRIEPGPNPTSKEILRERERARADAKGTESTAAEMNQSPIEESYVQQELVLANPVCFVEETIPMRQSEVTFLSTNGTSKMLCQPKSQCSSWDWDVDMIKMKEKSTALFIGIRWDQDCEMRS